MWSTKTELASLIRTNFSEEMYAYEASCRTQDQTVGTEPDPPENQRNRMFLQMEFVMQESLRINISSKAFGQKRHPVRFDRAPFR